jgi:hypothetical protein
VSGIGVCSVYALGYSSVGAALSLCITSAARLWAPSCCFALVAVPYLLTHVPAFWQKTATDPPNCSFRKAAVGHVALAGFFSFAAAKKPNYPDACNTQCAGFQGAICTSMRPKAFSTPIIPCEFTLSWYNNILQQAPAACTTAVLHPT